MSVTVLGMHECDAGCGTLRRGVGLCDACERLALEYLARENAARLRGGRLWAGLPRFNMGIAQMRRAAGRLVFPYVMAICAVFWAFAFIGACDVFKAITHR